ncbi:MAG: BatD family protein [Acidobacteria bacterium]|nr:BatD family protein [Acidobacteriota bacterium]
MRAAVLSVLFLAVSGSFVAQAADETTVQVLVDRHSPAVDQYVRLTYRFTGGNLSGIRPPTSLPLKNLTIARGPDTTAEMSFFNGDFRRSFSFVFTLRPTAQGQAEVGETVWTAGDQLVKAAAYVLDVGPPLGRPGPGIRTEEDDAANASPWPFGRPGGAQQAQTRRSSAILEYVVTADKTTAYVGEEITLHYELVTQISIAGLEMVEAPKFPGLWAEDLERPERPPGRPDNVNGQPVQRFTLMRKAISGLTPGTVTIPPAKVKLQVRSGDPFFDPFWNTTQVVPRETKPLNLTILASPGRPDFKGAVGRFDLTARVDRTSVEAGQAVTLKVKLAGTGNLRGVVEPPKLEVPGARLYPPTTKTDASKTGGRAGVSTEWEYVVVPQTGGALTIPPVALEVFDPVEKKVVKKSTQPVTLAVTGSVAPEPPIAAGTEPATGGAPATAASSDPGSAEMEPATPRPSAASAPAAAIPVPATTGVDLARGTVTLPLWALVAIPAALVVLGGLGALLFRRRQQALGLAARLTGEPGETKERVAAKVERTVRHELARRYGVPEEAAAPALCDALIQASAPEGLVVETRTLLAELDFLRFAPQLGDYEHKIADVKSRAQRILK